MLASPPLPMAATRTLPPRVAAPPVAPAPRVLLVAVAVCLLYAAFASGATDLPQESWLQLALAGIATPGPAAGPYGKRPAPSAAPPPGAGGPPPGGLPG